MHGERDGRPGSSPSPSMMTDDNSKSEANPISSNISSSQNPSAELAYLPIGCSVSAKYRGAFCSAQVKAIEKQVKLKVNLLDSGEAITVSEEQIVQSTPLRIGNTVTVRLNSSSRRQSNDSNPQSHYSRSGLAAFINSNNSDEKQATIKQIIDNSIYTVVFDDGDEKSLRRSSLCLQGVRLYQTQYGQQKILEEVPSNSTNNISNASLTSPPPSLISSNDTTHTNANDSSSVVAIQRQRNPDQPAFPALVLKRKALADYMWVRSFVDGREYIVHTRDDVQPFHDNPDVQALCRATSKQATIACEKFIKFNHIPAVWQKRKKKQTKDDDKDESSDEDQTSDNDSSSDESDDDDDDDIDEATAEEKDSFVAQLFTFMDDRGTPINNIPKVQNYDLDLHRLFKIVRMFGGCNKVTKNHQWDQIHMKMGLPDETSSVNGRSVESAYKKYLFAYEDLTKKLGSMNAPSAYLGGRTSLGGDSRRSLIRVRQQQQQQEEEKNSKKQQKPKSSPAAAKQKQSKFTESRPSSADSKSTSSSVKKAPPKSTPKPVRKGPIKSKPVNVISSSSSESESESESESSDDDTSKSSTSSYERTPKTKTKPTISSASTKKPITTPSNIPKKTTNIASSSKTDTKKTTANTKTPSTPSHESKQVSNSVKSVSSTKSKTSSPLQSVKKPPPSSTATDDKKKVSIVKSENKVSSVLTPKKTVPNPSKTSQPIKTTTSNKTTANESSKTTNTTTNKPSSTPTALSFKAKTSQSQASTNISNKDRSVSKSTSSSSSVDARTVKPQKTTSSMNKAQPDERSQSVPVKKTKPMLKTEISTKPLSSPSNIKIPKISSNTDSLKKSSTSSEKIPKKAVPKEGTKKSSSNQEHTINHQSTVNEANKSPSRTSTTESTKKTILPRDLSPITESTKSPTPALSCTSSISEEAIAPSSTQSSINTLSSVNVSHDNTPDHKTSDTTLVFHPIPDTPKEVQETEPTLSTSIKRSHPEETTEVFIQSTRNSDADENLSPIKRPRNSISSQESLDTLSSNDLTAHVDSIVNNRTVQLTYEDIAINDVLLVTWGSNGPKLYPARCIAKNDDKCELFVHYIKYNPRHDEWIKIDRVIERTDSNNGSSLTHSRIRRTSHISAVRQQHTDSTSSNSSTIGTQSNEQSQIPTPVPLNTAIPDPNITSVSIEDDDRLQKSIPTRSDQSTSIEQNKYIPVDISDSDENSQENQRSWPLIEPISSTEEDTPPEISKIQSASSESKSSKETISNQTLIVPIPNTISTVPIENLTANIIQKDFQTESERSNELMSTSDGKSPQKETNQRRSSSTSLIIPKTETIATAIPEHIETDCLVEPHKCMLPTIVKEEKIDNSPVNITVVTPTPVILKTETLPNSINILNATTNTAVAIRRGPTRQPKRGTSREIHGLKDGSATSLKKKAKFESLPGHFIETSFDSNSNFDQSSTRSNSTEQPNNETNTTKRARTGGRRGHKRATTQPDHENDGYRSSSPSSITMRQQLKEMFKHRPSRYNFLDLNNNLTGDERITHLKDRMRECQKVFFNLKSALVKIEKQRKFYLRKQKTLLQIAASTPTTIVSTNSSELLSTPSCT